MTRLTGVYVKIFLYDFGMPMMCFQCSGAKTGVPHFDNSLALTSGTIVGHERETEGFVLA